MTKKEMVIDRVEMWIATLATIGVGVWIVDLCVQVHCHWLGMGKCVTLLWR